MKELRKGNETREANSTVANCELSGKYVYDQVPSKSYP